MPACGFLIKGGGRGLSHKFPIAHECAVSCVFVWSFLAHFCSIITVEPLGEEEIFKTKLRISVAAPGRHRDRSSKESI